VRLKIKMHQQTLTLIFKTVQVKTGTELFWWEETQTKNKMSGHNFFHDFYNQTIVGIVLLICVSLKVLNSAKPIFFFCHINRKDMTCHESKIGFFEYVLS